MSKGLIVDEHGKVVGDVRICRVWAWDDPEWREQNGLPPKEKRKRRLDPRIPLV